MEVSANLPTSSRTVVHCWANKEVRLDSDMHRSNIQHTVQRVFSVTDPSRIGVIQFKSASAKQGFFKKTRNVSIKFGEDNTID